MRERRRRLVGKRSRYVILGLGALLVGLLAMSFGLMGTGIEDAEANAERRAARFAEAFLVSELTPELVARDITGTPYRDLLISVRAGLVSDDRVARVRIWKAGGDLIFSTAHRDNVDEFFGRDNPSIPEAALGRTVSVVTGDTIPSIPGLEGSDEKLYETYVPLEIEGHMAPYPVAQIDQRYASIEDSANRIWRLVQMFLILAIVGFVGVSAIALRQTPGAEPPASAQKWRSREERRRRDEEARALASAHAERQAGMGQRLARADERIRPYARDPDEVRRRLEEADLQVRAEQAEREQLVAESQRLRAALAEKEAELALERDGAAAAAASAAERAATERISRLEAALKQAEKRAADADKRVAEADRRAAGAEKRAAEASPAKRDRAAKADEDLRKAKAEVGELQRRLAEAKRANEGLEAARSAADESKVALDQTRDALDRTKATLDQTAAALEESRSELDETKASFGSMRAALEESTRAVEEAKTEARRAKEEAAAAAAEAENARAELARAVFEAERLQTELERRGADIERLVRERDGAAADAKRLAEERDVRPARVATAEEPTAPSGAAPARGRRKGAPDLATLEARVEEMEAQRRAEVVELQRAQESLTNTQFELLEATRKLKAAEERIHDLERDDGEPSTRRVRPPEPRPEPAYEPLPESFLEPRAERDAGDEEPQGPVAHPEDEADDVEEGLSLRERLARAAAARHRTGPPSS